MKIKRLFKCDEPHKYWFEQIFTFHYPNSPHNSQHMFDVYSLTHVFATCAMTFIVRKLFGNRHDIPLAIFLLKIIFEIYENSPKQVDKYHRVEVDSSGKSSYYGDSTINIIGDMISSGIGIYLGYQSDSNVLLTLFCLFFVITARVGWQVWQDFFYFLFN